MADTQGSENTYSLLAGLAALLSAIGFKHFWSRAKATGSEDRIASLERLSRDQARKLRERDDMMATMQSGLESVDARMHSITNRVQKLELNEQEQHRLFEELESAVDQLKSIMQTLRKSISRKDAVD